MKIRNGFVSNSSSSSFIINADYVSAQQEKQIFNHIEESVPVGKDNGIDLYAREGDDWQVFKEEDKILCDVSMDNFNLLQFVKLIGVPDEAITEIY